MEMLIPGPLLDLVNENLRDWVMKGPGNSLGTRAIKDTICLPGYTEVAQEYTVHSRDLLSIQLGCSGVCHSWHLENSYLNFRCSACRGSPPAGSFFVAITTKCLGHSSISFQEPASR